MQESNGDEVTSLHNEDPEKTKKNNAEIATWKTMQVLLLGGVTSLHNEDPGKTEKPR